MLTLDDRQLLEAYAARSSEEAFSALVSRHLNLVYSAALRQVGNRQEAEEITQAVFVVLARKAKSLRQGTVLSGWLYQTARLTAANSLRREIRRQNREQQAYMQSNLNEPEPDHWEQIGPLLEQAMSGLSEAGRNAIVLRYFENKPLKEVGAALGATDDAAKMRINRALEKLRAFFLKRGVTLSATALGAAISAHSIEAAPAGLSIAVVAAACQGSALTAPTLTLATGTLKLMAWTKLNIAATAAAVAVIALQWGKIQSQKAESAVLQHQLEQAALQSDKQLAAIKDLQTRDETMARSLRSIVAQTTQSAARKASITAPALPSRPSAGSTDRTGPLSMMEKMMNDPDFVKAMIEQQAQVLKTQYAPLVKQLNLTPEQRDAFLGLISASLTNTMSQSLEMMYGTNHSDAASNMAGVASAMGDAQKTLQDQVHSLLGNDGYAQYEQFITTLPDRQTLDLMKTSFTDYPLTDEQQQKLLEVMVAERKSTPSVVSDGPGIPGFGAANSAAQMDQAM